MAGEFQEMAQLAVLRVIEQGRQVDRQALAAEVPGADTRDISRAMSMLISAGQLRYEPRGANSPTELVLTPAGRQRLAEAR